MSQKKILFAIDDTESCERASEFLVRFFGDRSDCSIMLVHVKTPTVLYGEAALAAYNEIEEKEQTVTDKIMDKFVSVFSKNHIVVETKILEGEAVSEVLSLAGGYDLLVIGQSGDNFWNKIFSTNQNDFSVKSPIPILIVK